MSNQNMCEVCDTRGATVYYDEGHYCQSCYNEYQMFDGLTYQELKQARDYFMTRPSLKLTNPKTGQEYNSHEECQADIDDPNTETTEADIRRDVHVIAPQVFAGATTIEE